jgi:hypothetical protein
LNVLTLGYERWFLNLTTLPREINKKLFAREVEWEKKCIKKTRAKSPCNNT